MRITRFIGTSSALPARSARSTTTWPARSKSTKCTFSPSRKVASAPELVAELDAIRDRGYGIDDEENIEGLRCVAAPVKSVETVLGAVNVTGPASRVTSERIHDELADGARRAANVI